MIEPVPSQEVDNHLWFYESVTDISGLRLQKEIHQTERSLLKEQVSLGLKEPRPLILHINSPGGYLETALGIFDAISGLNVPSIGIGEGLVASAASIILMGFKRRVATPSSIFLLHQLSSGFGGTHQQFKDELIAQQILMQTCTRIYSIKSGMKPKAIQKKLKGDWWLSSREAKKLGFIHEVTNG